MGNSDSSASVKTLYANYSVAQKLQDQRYGDSKIVKSKINGEEFALKEINLTDDQKFKKLQLYLEKKLANHHPNIINLIKTYYSEDSQFCGQFFKIYLILEYAPITLYNILDQRMMKQHPFSEDELWNILIGSVEGFQRLESNQITHGNIKPTTISYIEENNLIKVYDPSTGNNLTIFQEVLSLGEDSTLTMCYLSPQLVHSLRDENKLIHNPYKSDVYSLGMVMLHAASLRNCDECYDYIKCRVHNQIVQKRINELESAYSPEFVQTLRTMLLLNEEQRPDFTQLKQEISLLNEPITNVPIDTIKSQVQQAPPPPPQYEVVQESFKSPEILEDYQAPNPETSAKFNSVVRNSQVPRQSTKMTADGLRDNIFKADRCDYLHQIRLSDVQAKPSNPDVNLGNEIRLSQDDELMQHMHQVTSIHQTQDIHPVSYDSYKLQRDTGYQEQQGSQNPKYEYLYDKQLSNQQKLSQYQTDLKKNFEISSITNSLRREKVIEDYPNGSRYEGEKLNGMRHGQGCFFYQDNGGVYEGQWFENKMHGYGTLFYASGKPAYEGDWVNDKFEGKGTLYNEEPQVLYGEFDFQDFDKIGEYWTKYNGSFHEDNKEGFGVLYLSNGDKFEGNFLQDLVSGPGKYVKKNGQMIQGRWWNNKLQ